MTKSKSHLTSTPAREPWQEELSANAHAAVASPGEPADSMNARLSRTVICPPDVKAEWEKVMAVARLKKAAQALLEENTEVARASHQEQGATWSDALWRRADPENARLCIELRRALKACATSLI